MSKGRNIKMRQPLVVRAREAVSLYVKFNLVLVGEGHLVEADGAVDVFLLGGVAVLVDIEDVLRRARDAQWAAHAAAVASHSLEEVGSLLLGAQQGEVLADWSMPFITTGFTPSMPSFSATWATPWAMPPLLAKMRP